MSVKSLQQFLVAMSLLSAGKVVCAGEKKVELLELGITLPATIETIQFQQRQSFEEKPLGYSVSYGNKRCAITLIVYDAGEKNIPAGKASPLVAEQMRRSIADMETAQKRGWFKNLQAMKGPLPLPPSVRETFQTAGYTFDIDRGACKSYVLLVARQNRFLKVRVTQFVVNRETNDAEINSFLDTLAKAVSAK